MSAAAADRHPISLKKMRAFLNSPGRLAGQGQRRGADEPAQSCPQMLSAGEEGLQAMRIRN